MLHRFVIAEFLKLRRSLTLFLCVAAPSCVVALNTIMWLRSDRAAPIGEFAVGASSLWAFGMLPLAITALGVLLAQMEHVPRSWLHILTLPGARPNVFLAKALVMLVLIAFMSTVLWVETLLGAKLVDLLRDDMSGEIYPGGLAALLSLMAAAATLAAMLQLWVALRFKSFVPPLVLGISATFIAIASTSSKEAIYFPWLMAAKIMSEPQKQQVALTLGSVGGVLALILMVVHLSRREA